MTKKGTLTMKKMNLALSLILLVGLLLAACQPSAPIDTPPVDEPPVENGYAYGEEAVVESLEVLLMESFPLQASAVVSGYLSDGCLELVEISVERQENEFILTLTTRRPTGDVMCTQALEFFEESVSLDIAGLEAGNYTVIAQDQQAQFTLDVDNVLQMEPITGGEGVLIGTDAVVENMSVMIMESYPVQVSVELSGYLPDGCTTIREVRSSRDGDIFNVQIVTQRPDGDVMCTMALVPFNERVNLEVEGLPAGEYTVQSGELSETFTLDTDN
jgi:hypothetical protein